MHTPKSVCIIGAALFSLVISTSGCQDVAAYSGEDRVSQITPPSPPARPPVKADGDDENADPVEIVTAKVESTSEGVADSDAFLKVKLDQIAQDVERCTDAVARKQLMSEFLMASAPYARRHLEDTRVWQLRGAAALEVDDVRAGWGAGKVLSAQHRSADKSQTTINVLVALDRRGWLARTPNGARRNTLTPAERQVLGKWQAVWPTQCQDGMVIDLAEQGGLMISGSAWQFNYLMRNGSQWTLNFEHNAFRLNPYKGTLYPSETHVARIAGTTMLVQGSDLYIKCENGAPDFHFRKGPSR